MKRIIQYFNPKEEEAFFENFKTKFLIIQALLVIAVLSVLAFFDILTHDENFAVIFGGRLLVISFQIGILFLLKYKGSKFTGNIFSIGIVFMVLIPMNVLQEDVPGMFKYMYGFYYVFFVFAAGLIFSNRYTLIINAGLILITTTRIYFFTINQSPEFSTYFQAGYINHLASILLIGVVFFFIQKYTKIAMNKGIEGLKIQKQKNEELLIIQQKLQASQYELQNQNLFLDKRVIQRTQELEKRNSELEASQRENHKLSQAVNQTSASIVITNLEGQIEYTNPAFTKKTGYTAAEAKSVNPNVLKSGYTTDNEYKDLWETITNGKTWKGEFLNVKKNKDTYWEKATITPILDKNNQTISYLAIKEDVTKQKLAEQALKASEEKFRAIIETSPDGIAITSLEGKTQYVSPQIVSMWGYDSAEEMLGRNMTDFFHSNYHTKAAQSIVDMFNGNYAGAEEYIMIRKDGSEFFGEGIANILYNQSNEPEGILLAERDISNRKKNEREIKRQNDELTKVNATKDKFFSIIAHDLKNPFGVILGYSDLLVTESIDYDKERILKIIGMMHQSAKNAFKLLENLLEWSRSQTGSISFEPKELGLRDLVIESENLCENLSKEKNISITNEIPKNFMIYADPNMLSTILRNLITNAIKFTHKNGRVAITSSLHKLECVITVSDTGVGMNEDTSHKLFEISDKTLSLGTEKEKGTGLGLLLCKEFVEKHNGKIWVESELGLGSHFKFSIPLNS